MKIAIFGDSFGEDSVLSTDIAWPTLLKEKYNVTNYCASASSLYYSVSAFLKDNHKFDKIIFLLTQPGRLYIPEIECPHTSGIEHSKRLVEVSKDFLSKASHTAAISYYTYLYNKSQANLFDKLMFNECLKNRPDTLFIPCFPESNYQNHPQVMFDINMIDFNYFNLKDDFLNGRIDDRRQCHMNSENNKIFAALIEDWLTTDKFSIDLTKFVSPVGKNIKDLFVV